MNDIRQSIDKLFAQIPNAVWAPGHPIPYVYRGTPVEMVGQMAEEMGGGVTVGQAMDALIESLARNGRLRLRIVGDPPENVRAGIFVYSLLQHGICHPMPKA